MKLILIGVVIILVFLLIHAIRILRVVNEAIKIISDLEKNIGKAKDDARNTLSQDILGEIEGSLFSLVKTSAYVGMKVCTNNLAVSFLDVKYFEGKVIAVFDNDQQVLVQTGYGATHLISVLLLDELEDK
ncbi:MAG: hypothetical protein ACM3KR_07560 [Deltaproteobacteria bacterium]